MNEDIAVSYTQTGHTKEEKGLNWQRQYSYNAAERLSKVEDKRNDRTASYTYDPFGRRISKTITQGKTSATTYYIYGEHGLMAEADEQGTLTKAYGFHPDAQANGLWSTNPVWQADVKNGKLKDEQTQWHYLHTDHLGTPYMATNKQGEKTWRAYSQAFGEAIIDKESTTTVNLRFPGQYYDEETGTHYNFQRDYSPYTGRYLQADPIGLEGGLNLYGYVGGNPVSEADSTGEYWQLPALFCLRFPRICRAISMCFKNPTSCRKKFCLAGNRLYHPMCDKAGCNRGDSCTVIKMKLAWAEGCYVGRLAISWFCGKKSDPEHEKQKEMAWKKAQDCLALLSGGCEECQ